MEDRVFARKARMNSPDLSTIFALSERFKEPDPLLHPMAGIALSKRGLVAGVILAVFLVTLLSGCTSQTATERTSAPPPTTGKITISPTTSPPATAVVTAVLTAAAPTQVKPTFTPVQTARTSVDVCICSDDLYNCADFSLQRESQACFDHCQSIGKGDVHRLDSDKDGIACESLK